MPRTKRPPAKKKLKIGRHSRLTTALTTDACKLIGEQAHPPEAALGSLGIARTTYYRWMREGGEKDADPLKKKFYERINTARARQEGTFTALIASQAPSDWRAAAFMLERRFPKRWGRRQVIEFGDVNMDDLTDEQLDAIIAGEPAEKVLGDKYIGSTI